MMRVSSNLRSPLHAGQTRMALSSSSITRSPPLRIALEPGECPGQAVVEHRARRPSEDGLRPCGVEHAPPLLTLTRGRSEEHTSELQSQSNLVCRLLLEKKKKNTSPHLRRQIALRGASLSSRTLALAAHTCA